MKEIYLYPPPPTLPPGSDVISYVRDSGGTLQGESRWQQSEIMKNYCNQHKLNLTMIFSETASGRETKKRKEFNAMMDYLTNTPKDARPRGLLIWSTSRFMRNLKKFNRNVSVLLDEGLILHSLTQIFPEGISGQFLMTVAAYTDERYSEDLSISVMRGLHNAISAGFCNGGPPPRGYKAIKAPGGYLKNGDVRYRRKWEVNEDLRLFVQIAWQLRSQGKGYNAITIATEEKLYTNKGSWISFFRNKSYLGIGKAGDLEVPDHHEPLITWELWDAVRKVEKARDTEFHNKRMKYPSLLAGLSYCLHCGAAMILHTSRDYRCYVCGKRDRQRGAHKDCSESRKVNARKAERSILDTIHNHIFSRDFAELWIAEIQSQMTNDGNIDKEIGKLTKNLIAAERSITRLIELAQSTGDIEEIAKELRNKKLEKSENETKIKSLKAQRDAEIPQITIEALIRALDSRRVELDTALNSGDIPMAKKVISQFIERIELSNKSAIIHPVFPAAIPAFKTDSISAHKVP